MVYALGMECARPYLYTSFPGCQSNLVLIAAAGIPLLRRRPMQWTFHAEHLFLPVLDQIRGTRDNRISVRTSFLGPISLLSNHVYLARYGFSAYIGGISL